MIYIIHKISELLKDSIFKCFFKEYGVLLFFICINFSRHLMIKSSWLKKDKKKDDNITKDVRNLFRLKKK